MSGLPGLLIAQAEKMPTKSALRSHQLGIWEPTTWAQLLSHTAAAGMGLLAIGAKAGDVVAIVASNHASSIATEIGAQGVGLVTLLIDPSTSGGDIAGLLRDRHAAFAVVGDEEQHDKLVEHGAITGLRRVVVMETRGLRHLDDVGAPLDAPVVAYSRVRVAGEDKAAGWVALAASRNGSEPAAILGGRVHSHDALAAAGQRTAQSLALTPRDSTLAVMPLADVTGHTILAAALAAGFPVQLSKNSAQAVRDLRVVRPTVLVAPPMLLNTIKGDADNRARTSKGLKKAAYEAGLRRGASAPKEGAAARPVPPHMLAVGALLALAFVVYSALSVKGNPVVRVIIPFAVIGAVVYGLARSGLLTARPVRSRYGLSAARTVLTSADGVSPEVRSWFAAIGVPLRADSALHDSSGDNHDAVSGRGR